MENNALQIAGTICPRAIIMMIIPCWDRPALLIQIIKFLSNNIKRQQGKLQSLKRKRKTTLHEYAHYT
jgi:hypothetical protein